MATKDTRGIGPVPDALEKIDPDGWLTQLRRYILDLQFGRVAALAGTATGASSTAPAPAPTPGPPGPPGPPAGPYIPDLTPPPTPTGGNVLAGLDFIGITTDAPTFTMGHGYQRTRVYGAKYSGTGPLPTFGSAVLVHEFVGQVGTFPSEPRTEWHIWLTWLTNDGVESVSPAGGTNGFTDTTGTDPTKLLEALTGVITESQLYAALGARINLIDGPSTMLGSVAQRILDEATARGTAIASEASARSTADAAITTRTDTLSAVFQVGALNADPGMFSPSEFWTFEAGSVTRVTGSSATRFAFRSTAQANYFDKRRIPFDTSKTYRLSAKARSSTGSAGLDGFLYLVIQAYDAAGNPVPQWGAGGSYSFYPVASVLPGAAWTDFSASFSAAVSGIPGSVTSISVGVIQSYAATGGWMEVEQVRLIDDTTTVVAAGLSAAIATEQTARASGDTALASQITALSSTVTTNNTAALAAISSEASTRAAADGAISTQLTNLISSYNTTTAAANAAIAAEATTRANQDTALAGSINSLGATLSTTTTTLNVAIATEQTARASGDAANASSITTLQSVVQGQSLVNSDFAQGSYAWSQVSLPFGIATDTAAKGGKVARFAGTGTFGLQHDQPFPVNTQRTYLVRTRVRRFSGTGGNFYFGTRCFDSSNAEITSTTGANYPYTAAAGVSIPADGQWYEFSGTIAGTAPTTATDPNKFFTGTVKASVIAFVQGVSAGSTFDIDYGEIFDNNEVHLATVAIQQEATTRASTDSGLLAQWTVKTDINGYVSGFGLASTSNGATPSSSFLVRADNFAIASPTGPGITPIVPFAVQTTPVTTAAGEVLPVGVYIDAAYVRNLEVALGRFSNAIITNALIVSVSASKITAGSIAVGEYIQSSAFTPGGTGFRIDGGGGVEIRNAAGTRVFNLGASGAQSVLKVGSAIDVLANGTASFGGTVTANAGAIGGITIDANGLKSTNYVAGVSGFKFDAAGTAQLPAAAILGTLSTTNLIGSAGESSLSAASLTLSGGAFGETVTTGFEINLDALQAGSSATIDATFGGTVNITLASSFTGSSANYPVIVEVDPKLDVWNGSSWVTPGVGFVVSLSRYRVPMFLAPSDTINVPVHTGRLLTYVAADGYTKARLRLVMTVQVRQFPGAGGALKTDALSAALVQGVTIIRQAPG